MASSATAQTMELAQTAKRDYLIDLEKRYQKKWGDERVFHVDAPTPDQLAGLSPAQIKEKYPKWFGCFPFPYMNGSLHLGHAFTISKIEFGAGYQRLLGRRALFPHGFHCTGMPIKAAADKIVREIEMFGDNFENFGQEEDEQTTSTASKSTAVGKAAKGKLQAKSTGHTYQFQIMESIGVPRPDVKKFADPRYWLEYFPPIAIKDHKAIGTRIDWRRSFLTTDINPYYDSFVRWQMNKLHDMGKIQFGERYTVYSPKDGQPCMDHDRSEGEALGPQEYTAVKMEVVSWPNPEIEKLVNDRVGGKKVFMVAATLRPETMYGQTNCFVGPSLQYGIFPSKNPDEAYLCTYRAARNMAFQGSSSTQHQVEQLLELEGSQIVGSQVKAPFAVNSVVYVLPMDGVLPTKGTGVVTSVPSDSPDDFATTSDLMKKPEFYKVKPEWVANLAPVPVISTPTYGEMTAPAVVKKLKINSQKDTKQLAEAKEIAYKEGFYNGTMLIGDFKGEPVQEAKPKVRAQMIEKGVALAYAEPEGLVISRSGDECVVALIDQWYIDYGEESWKTVAEKLVARMDTYVQETRNGFEGVLNWLNKWACARSFGLGSRLPWDPQWLVESLSDSTIYMAYYTVAHHLHEDIKGERLGPMGIKASEMTDEVWDYIFRDGPLPANSTISRKHLDHLKSDFNYFYPFDIRSSGKDLIPNHLTFCVYNHAALFPEDKWPVSMRTNGHLMLNGKKMSKSTGNSLTMKDSVEKFGADATRVVLADAGDGIEDANFEEKNANANVLRIHTLVQWCEEMIKEQSKLRTGPRIYHDLVFEEEIKNLINVTKEHYEATFYKDALKYGFFELQSARDWYREITADVGGMHVDLVKHWIEIAALLASPIAPHFTEHVWSTVLAKPQSIQLASWPTPTSAVDAAVVEAGNYMRGTIKTIRDAELNLIKKMSRGKTSSYDPKKPKAVRVYVASKFPEWQNECVEAVKEAHSDGAQKVDDGKVREILQKKGLLKDKRAMPFIQLFKKRMQQFGAEAAFKRQLLFSEVDALNEILGYLKKSLSLVDAEVLTVEEALVKSEANSHGYNKMIIESSEPGTPAFEFRNV